MGAWQASTSDGNLSDQPSLTASLGSPAEFVYLALVAHNSNGDGECLIEAGTGDGDTVTVPCGQWEAQQIAECCARALHALRQYVAANSPFTEAIPAFPPAPTAEDVARAAPAAAIYSRLPEGEARSYPTPEQLSAAGWAPLPGWTPGTADDSPAYWQLIGAGLPYHPPEMKVGDWAYSPCRRRNLRVLHVCWNRNGRRWRYAVAGESGDLSPALRAAWYQEVVREGSGYRDAGPATPSPVPVPAPPPAPGPYATACDATLEEVATTLVTLDVDIDRLRSANGDCAHDTHLAALSEAIERARKIARAIQGELKPGCAGCTDGHGAGCPARVA